MAFGMGKVILIGEHAVVHGRPALACAIDRGVSARGESSARDELVVIPWDRRVAPDPDADDPLGRAFHAVLSVHPGERVSIRVTADVDLPAGAGLGCSAALGVAVAGAIDEALGMTRTPEALAELTLGWERIFHGNPSGVDNTVAACGGAILFRRGSPLEAVTPASPLLLVVCDSGEPSSTRDMVAAVDAALARSPEEMGGIFDEMGMLAERGAGALRDGDLAALGSTMYRNGALLERIGVSTARLDLICEAARAAGALGAKLTGAGGGGCAVALVADREHAQRVSEALIPLGREVFVVEGAS